MSSPNFAQSAAQTFVQSACQNRNADAGSKRITAKLILITLSSGAARSRVSDAIDFLNANAAAMFAGMAANTELFLPPQTWPPTTGNFNTLADGALISPPGITVESGLINGFSWAFNSATHYAGSGWYDTNQVVQPGNRNIRQVWMFQIVTTVKTVFLADTLAYNLTGPLGGLVITKLPYGPNFQTNAVGTLIIPIPAYQDLNPKQPPDTVGFENIFNYQ